MITVKFLTVISTLISAYMLLIISLRNLLHSS